MATFDQYMAESGQQSTLDQLRKNFQYDTAKSQYESQGWYGVSPTQRAQQSALDAANAEMARQRQLTEQAIGTLQSQQPKIAQIYGEKKSVLQSQIDPTKQRYDALIADLKNQQTTAEQGSLVNWGREAAKRGISELSGLYGQEQENVLNPIRRNYSGLIQQTGLAGEADIKAIQDAIKLLAGEQAGSELSLAGLISQAQMGGAGNALTASGQLLSNAQSQAQLAQQQAEAQAQQNYQNAVLAMQQQLQPYQVKSADLSNQLAQYNLTHKNTPSTTDPNDIILNTIKVIQSLAGEGLEPKPGT